MTGALLFFNSSAYSLLSDLLWKFANNISFDFDFLNRNIVKKQIRSHQKNQNQFF